MISTKKRRNRRLMFKRRERRKKKRKRKWKPAYTIIKENYESEKDRAQCIFSINEKAYTLECENMKNNLPNMSISNLSILIY